MTPGGVAAPADAGLEPDLPSGDAGLTGALAGGPADPKPGTDPGAAACRAEGTPEPLAAEVPVATLFGLAGAAGAAASEPVDALPPTGPDSAVSSEDRSAAGEAGSAGP
jgi:hypothetical protein